MSHNIQTSTPAESYGNYKAAMDTFRAADDARARAHMRAEHSNDSRSLIEVDEAIAGKDVAKVAVAAALEKGFKDYRENEGAYQEEAVQDAIEAGYTPNFSNDHTEQMLKDDEPSQLNHAHRSAVDTLQEAVHMNHAAGYEHTAAQEGGDPDKIDAAKRTMDAANNVMHAAEDDVDATVSAAGDHYRANQDHYWDMATQEATMAGKAPNQGSEPTPPVEEK
jgi:hypothetical protein